MAVHMTRSNEIQGSTAGRLLDMILPRPSSTFLLRCAEAPGAILVVDRAVPPRRGERRYCPPTGDCGLQHWTPASNPPVYGEW